MEVLEIEGALYRALADDGYSASAPPLPADFDGSLPHVHVVRTGGYEHGPVQDAHQVDFDVYAEDDAAAMVAASALCGWVRALAGKSLDGAPVYSAGVTTLPYGNHDPRRADLSRATFKAQLITRAV